MDKFVSFVLVALRLAVLVVDHTLTIVGNVSAVNTAGSTFLMLQRNERYTIWI